MSFIHPLSLSQTLLIKAANNRHGLTFEPLPAELSLSDIGDLNHYGAPATVEAGWQSASGGISYDAKTARLAAIAEAIERYCAAVVKTPLKGRHELSPSDRLDADQWCLFSEETRSQTDFPFGQIYSDECMYTDVYSLENNRQVWVPQPLVVLRDDYQTGIPTSSGLAAGRTTHMAMLRAIQELIERDALMVTWLHSLPARAVKVPRQYQQAVEGLHGEVWAFDLTPSYSPFPVVAVAGGIPKRGQWRYSLGVACRETWSQALEKAYLEWNQGVLFAGIFGRYTDTDAIVGPDNVNSFDQHAIYYTLHPDQWHDLPMFSNRQQLHRPSKLGRKKAPIDSLKLLKRALIKSDIRIYYRELSTLDVYQTGIRVVRATSPDMANIFAHQLWPLTGGVKDKLISRYPWAPGGLEFPNRMPHPLG